MIFFLLFSQIFLFSNQNIYTDNYGKIVKKKSMENISSYNISIYSPNNKLLSKLNNNSNYYFISFDKKLSNNYSFLGSGREISYNYERTINYLIILISTANCFFFCLFRLFYTSIERKLEVYIIANYLLISCLFLTFSCIIFRILTGISFIYSIYKSYLFASIYYLSSGYKILYFNDLNIPNKKIVAVIIIGLLESTTTLLILYLKKIHKINFYFICGRNLIEYLILLAIVIKMFLSHFINVYRQYRFERRIRTYLTIAYKYKLIIYSKVFIFSLLNCLAFIAINIFPMIIFSKKDYVGENKDEILFIYYANVSLAILFAMIFTIMFFPHQTSKLFFMESYININMYFLTEIKKDKEKNMKINNLRKNILKKIYYKKEYPLVLLEPFAKTNNFLNNCNLHVGITKKN